MKSYVFRYFFIPYLLFLILGVMFVSISKHGDAVLWMNNIHNDFLNAFFKIWTHLGDWVAYALVAVALLVKSRKAGYVFLLVGLVQGVVFWSMKNLLFAGTPRPKKYFEGQEMLDLVEGVAINDYGSFPSGHTATAFAIAAFLTFVFANRNWAIVFLLSAVLVGLSRIYLNQHFMIDVTIGSLIGVSVALIGYKSFEKYLNS